MIFKDTSTIVGNAGNWKLSTEDNGGASNQTIQTAALVELVYELRRVRDVIQSIRHFFHGLGDLQLIVSEQVIRHRKIQRERRRRSKKRNERRVR